MKRQPLRHPTRDRLATVLALLIAGLLALWEGGAASLRAQGGSLIAFTSNRTGHDDVYLIHADGGPAINLTNSPESESSPAWSPDGERLAFTVYGEYGMGDIWMMNIDGSLLVNLTQDQAMDVSPAWSPDGRWITFVSDRDGEQDIYLLDVTAPPPAEPINLTQNSGLDSAPAWSPDGTRLVFSSSRNGAWDLYLMTLPDPLGGGPLPADRLTITDGHEGSPAWSPDGARIAYDRTYGQDLADIFLIDVLAEPGLTFPEPRQLTDHPATDYGPSWSPDGTQIVFFSYRDGDFDLYLLDVPASPDAPVGEPTALTVNDRTSDAWPAWQPEPSLALPTTPLTAPPEAPPSVTLLTFDGDRIDWDRTILCTWGTLDGGLTWTFTLCPGTAYPDGRLVTPEDVALAVRHVVEDDPALRALLPPEGILAPEGNRLSFVLARPDESFPLRLDGLAVSPTD